MNLIGNPFVDVGLAIAVTLSNQKSLSDISDRQVSDAVKFLRANIGGFEPLKGILSAFWVNNPFMGKNLNQKPKFDRYLKSLGDRQLPTKPGYCQVCGQSPVIGETDRCWFPLAASADSDPCTLPGLRGKAVCATCLSAAVLLPLGCRFCREGPYFIHVAEPDLQIEAVSEGVRVVRRALASKTDGALRHSSTLSGRLGLLEIVSGSILWDHTQAGHMTRIPQGGATIISFSNRGTAPTFTELHLPSQALEFFGAIFEAGVQEVFLGWVKQGQKLASKSRRRDYTDQLCDGVETRRSLAPVLFPVVKDHADGSLRREERQVLQIYEDIALKKKDRFDTLERIAGKIKQMDDRYRESFIKQLGNAASKDRLLQLLKAACKSEKLTMNNADLRVIDYGPANEVITLLYLLCVTEE
jgi:hypothetical protein